MLVTSVAGSLRKKNRRKTNFRMGNNVDTKRCRFSAYNIQTNCIKTKPINH